MSVRVLKEALVELKLASAEGTKIPDNESEMKSPIALQSEPEKKTHDPEACFRELATGQNEILGKAFSEFGSSSKKDRAFISENFSSKDYESHSPLLRKHAQVGHLDCGASLAERTRGLVPR